MRIGIDIRCLLDEPMSGVGEYTYNFLNKIFNDNKNNEYVLFSTGLKKSNIIRELEMEFSSEKRVKFFHIRYPNKILNLLWFLGFGPKIDKLLRVKTIWFPNYNFLNVSKEARVIVTCHDLSFLTVKKQYSIKGRVWHWFISPLSIYRRADVVLPVSKATRNDLTHLKISKEKIKVIYPIIPWKDERVKDDELKNYYNLPEKFFLYIGTLDARKNILYLIKAFSKFKKEDDSMKLVIGGRPGWHSRMYYKKLFDLIENNEDIVYLGYIPKKVKNNIYNKALAFIYPSLYEGFGFPPLEAMQNKCPVICSYSSSLTEVIKDAALLVDPYNINDLVSCFKKIISIDLQTRLIKKGNEVCNTWKQENKKSYTSLINVLEDK